MKNLLSIIAVLSVMIGMMPESSVAKSKSRSKSNSRKKSKSKKSYSSRSKSSNRSASTSSSSQRPNKINYSNPYRSAPKKVTPVKTDKWGNNTANQNTNKWDTKTNNKNPSAYMSKEQKNKVLEENKANGHATKNNFGKKSQYASKDTRAKALADEKKIKDAKRESEIKNGTAKKTIISEYASPARKKELRAENARIDENKKKSDLNKKKASKYSLLKNKNRKLRNQATGRKYRRAKMMSSSHDWYDDDFGYSRRYGYYSPYYGYYNPGYQFTFRRSDPWEAAILARYRVKKIERALMVLGSAGAGAVINASLFHNDFISYSDYQNVIINYKIDANEAYVTGNFFKVPSKMTVNPSYMPNRYSRFNNRSCTISFGSYLFVKSMGSTPTLEYVSITPTSSLLDSQCPTGTQLSSWDVAKLRSLGSEYRSVAVRTNTSTQKEVRTAFGVTSSKSDNSAMFVETNLDDEITICTGTKSGYYRFAGEKIVNLINSKDNKEVKTGLATETNGSIQNLQMMANGSCSAAIVQSDALNEFNANSGGFNVRAVGPSLYYEYAHLVCNADLDVDSIKDLDPSEHTIAIGRANSGSELTWKNLTSASKKLKSIKTTNMTEERALKDVISGHTTCFFNVSALNTPFMNKVNKEAEGRNLSILAVSKDFFDTIPTDNMEEAYRFGHMDTNEYPALGFESWFSIQTVMVPANLVVADEWGFSEMKKVDALNDAAQVFSTTVGDKTTEGIKGESGTLKGRF